MTFLRVSRRLNSCKAGHGADLAKPRDLYKPRKPGLQRRRQGLRPDLELAVKALKLNAAGKLPVLFQPQIVGVDLVLRRKPALDFLAEALGRELKFSRIPA